MSDSDRHYHDWRLGAVEIDSFADPEVPVAVQLYCVGCDRNIRIPEGGTE